MHASRMKTMSLVLSCSLSLSAFVPLASADRSACDDRCCHAPMVPSGTPQASFAREPAQRAIILWNGTEEILFLATDLAYAEPAVMLEMIALPTEPTIRMGELATFSKLAALAASRSPSRSFPVAASPNGAMSNVQVLKTESLPSACWRKGLRSIVHPLDIPPHCDPIVSGLKSRGFDWLVLDQVNLTSTVQSFPPVEYRFKSSQVFYPIELSKQNTGDTKIDLVVIAPKRLTSFSATSYPVEHLGSFDLDPKELSTLSSDWPTFMGSQPVVVEHLRMVGDIRKMTQDLWAH